MEIKLSDIDKQKWFACKLIRSGEMPQTPNDLFVYLSASTFLNACAKLPQYKKRNGYLYGLIKPSINRLVHYLIEDCNEIIYDELGFTYEDSTVCVYIRCLGVQFSYHNITMDEVLKSFADSGYNNPGHYEAEFKQPMSYSLYHFARFCKSKNITSKPYIQRRIHSFPINFPILLKRHEGTNELKAFLELHSETCTIINDKEQT